MPCPFVLLAKSAWKQGKMLRSKADRVMGSGLSALCSRKESENLGWIWKVQKKMRRNLSALWGPSFDEKSKFWTAAWETRSTEWSLDANWAFAVGVRKIMEILDLFGRPQDFPVDTNWLLVCSPAVKERNPDGTAFMWSWFICRKPFYKEFHVCIFRSLTGALIIWHLQAGTKVSWQPTLQLSPLTSHVFAPFCIYQHSCRSAVLFYSDQKL